MSFRLPPALVAGIARLRPVLLRLREQRFWLELGALSLLALLAAVAIGRSALARADALEAEAARGARIHAGVRRWTSEIQWPTPAESLAWRASEEALEPFRGGAAEPLAVAHLLAGRAEEVGVTNLRVRLVPTDSIALSPAAHAAGWAVEPAGAGIVVEFSGDWSAIVSFLGALPPQVEVIELRSTEEGDGMRTSALLLPRRVVPVE